jgi:predicted N-formylglutamate amidohydrolase
MSRSAVLAQRLLWVVDHASNEIPEDLRGLGLDPALLEEHIAWDIGTELLAKLLRLKLGGRLVTANVSRLVIDMNREPDHPGLIPERSDKIAIPGNLNLSDAERQRRLDEYFHPYHDRIGAELDAIATRSRGAILIALHSFTPSMNGVDRPWHCGVLYNRDNTLAKRTLEWLKGKNVPGGTTPLIVGDNEPYSGKLLNYTMDRHAEARGLRYLSFEIRQDLLADEVGIARWGQLLIQMIPDIVRG